MKIEKYEKGWSMGFTHIEIPNEISFNYSTVSQQKIKHILLEKVIVDKENLSYIVNNWKPC